MHEVGARLTADEACTGELLFDTGLVRGDALLVLHIDGEWMYVGSWCKNTHAHPVGAACAPAEALDAQPPTRLARPAVVVLLLVALLHDDEGCVRSRVWRGQRVIGNAYLSAEAARPAIERASSSVRIRCRRYRHGHIPAPALACGRRMRAEDRPRGGARRVADAGALLLRRLWFV